MESFLQQLDQFLSSLNQSGFSSLVSELHSRNVLSSEEKSSLEALRESRDIAKAELIAVLVTKRDGKTLRALSQSLRAFKILYKETQSKSKLM